MRFCPDRQASGVFAFCRLRDRVFLPGIPVQASLPGVSTATRVRQFRQETVRAILKWSRGDRLMMMFSALQKGQAYRITYPAWVPLTSG